MPPGLKLSRGSADDHLVTKSATQTTLDPERETIIVGKLYQRVMEHIPAQYERQAGQCAGCGKTLPTMADGLLRLDGQLECIDCSLRNHHTVR